MTGTNPKKKLFIKTWGCQMNVYDSERMQDVVAPLGYAPTDLMKDADLVIFNTCHIREKANDKLFSELGRLRPMQKETAENGGRMMIAVAGCVAQAEGAEIQRRAPYVDMVFGPQTYHQLPEMIARLTRSRGSILNTEFPPESKFDQLPEEKTKKGVSGFLSVQEGCDKFCTFCVVPYTRGSEYSRPVKDILHEASLLLENGAREITLLGQNVNAFHGVGIDGETWDLGRLLFALARLPELKRLRYTTSHPSDMHETLIAAHRDLSILMPFLHLPVQSGSNRVLAAMNRKHEVEAFKDKVARLRSERRDLALSSDFIVGFPGEEEEDFDKTMDLIRDTGFAQAYSFKYSKRPGTPAAAMQNQVAEEIKDRRLAVLQAEVRDQQQKFNASFIGKEVMVLFENESEQEGKLFGRTPYLQPCRVQGPAHLVGKEQKVRIETAAAHMMTGSLVTDLS